MKKKLVKSILLGCVGLWFATSCTEEALVEENLNLETVQIQSKTFSKKELAYGQTSTINLNLGLEDLTNIDVEWVASGGEFTKTNKNQATWKAPNLKGIYEIAVNITHKGITKQLQVTSLPVVGAFIDNLTTINRSVWVLFTTRTSYSITNNAMVIKPIDFSEKGSAITVVDLKEVFEENNQLPQSSHWELSVDLEDFKEEESSYAIYYNWLRPEGLPEEEWYLTSIGVYVFPKTKKVETRITYRNISLDQGFFSRLNSTTIPDENWKETHEIGISIDKDFNISSYFNQSPLISRKINLSNYNGRTLHYNINNERMVLLNDGKISISKVIYDNTPQKLYSYKDVISF